MKKWHQDCKNMNFWWQQSEAVVKSDFDISRTCDWYIFEINIKIKIKYFLACLKLDSWKDINLKIK